MLDKSVLNVTRHLPRLSLEDMSIIKMITTLCNNRQLLTLILSCYFENDIDWRMRLRAEKEWKAVHEKANELISQICSSVLLKKKMFEYLWIISDRIMHWKSVYAPSISNENLQFYWADRGRIDTARTARHIIRNKNISVRRRFELACNTCLEEDLSALWSEMSCDDQKYFCRQKFKPLNLFWVCTLKGFYKNHEEKVLLAIKYAIEKGMLEAVKYILGIIRKFNYEHNLISFMNLLFMKLNYKYHLEVDENTMAYFLFFQMDDSDQEIFFKSRTVKVLSLLLHASEYKLCRALLEERFKFYSKNGFRNCFEIYLRVILYTYFFEVSNDDACRELFVEVWRMLPASLKNSVHMPYVRVQFPTTLISVYFPFVYEKEAVRKIDELTSTDINTKNTAFDFHEEKWDFLCFFIEEITKDDWLIKYNNYVFFPTNTRESEIQSLRLKLIRFFRYLEKKITPSKN